MSNDLSKQLCELCGIEPKKIKKCKAGQGCADFPGCEGRFGDKTCYIEQTVDFTKPENFVRLQKLLIEGGMGFDIQLIDYPTKLQICFCWDDENFTFKVHGNSLQEVFLCFAIQICELDEEGDIKQSIREAEWVYD